MRQWLNEAGIDDARITSTGNSAWLVFAANGTELESLLHAEYYDYKDNVSGKQMVACEQ